jgi:hypothetical protein
VNEREATPVGPIFVRPPARLLEKAWGELDAEDHKELDAWLGGLLSRVTENG